MPLRHRSPARLAPAVLAAALAGGTVLSAGAALSTPPSVAAASSFYVSGSGSDANPGTLAAPWRTLQHAADAVPAGSTVYLRAGTYAGATISRSGASGIPTTYAAYPGEHPTIRGDAAHTRVVRITGASDVTLTGLTIAGAPAQWGAGLWIDGSSRITAIGLTLRDNHSFGAKVVGSSDVHLVRLDVFGNDTGVEASGAIGGFRLVDSTIHDQDTMVTDGSGSARGANATNFFHTTGSALVARNRIWNERARSATYGADGGAFEVYGSSGITYAENVVWDGQNVMELGTDGPVNSVTFVRNVAYRPSASTATVSGRSQGILVRACHDCLFANNTFIDLDDWTFLVVTSNFTAGVANERVRFANNLVRQANGKALSAGSWSGVTIDHDRFWLVGGTVGRAFDSTSSVGDPRVAGASFRPASGSPLVDAGAVIAGVTNGYTGAAPDIGRWELGAAEGMSLSSLAAGAGALPAGSSATAGTSPTSSSSTTIVDDTSARIGWRGTWGFLRATAYLGGTARWSRIAGSSATLAFVGRSVTIVGPTGPARGRMAVYIDGRLSRIVDLSRSTVTSRAVLFGHRWTGSGRHVLRVVVLAASGRTVALDRFVIRS